MAPGHLLWDMKRNLTLCYISVLAKIFGFWGWHLGTCFENEKKSHCLLYFCFSKDIWFLRMAPWHLLWEWKEISLSAIFLFQQRYLGSEDGTLALCYRTHEADTHGTFHGIKTCVPGLCSQQNHASKPNFFHPRTPDLASARSLALAMRMKRNLTVCYISVTEMISGFPGWHLGTCYENEENSHCLLYFCYSKDVWVQRMAPWHLLWEWREISLSDIFQFQQRYLG